MNHADHMANKKATLNSFLAPIRERNRKVEMKCLKRIPASAADVPQGKVVVHNRVYPAPLYVNGFRAWTQLSDDAGIEVCPCEWAPRLGKHYRVRARAAVR